MLFMLEEPGGAEEPWYVLAGDWQDAVTKWRHHLKQEAAEDVDGETLKGMLAEGWPGEPERVTLLSDTGERVIQ